MYRVTQAYGGPEEGGWWYPEGEPVGSRMCMSEEELAEQRAKLGAKADELNENVNRGVYYRVIKEDHFAEAYPKQRPTYE